MAILSFLYDRPNRVVEMQKRIQADTRPIYQRLPRSNIYLKAYYLAFTVGMIGTTYGIGALIVDKKKTA